jgi:hypothetical protein
MKKSIYRQQLDELSGEQNQPKEKKNKKNKAKNREGAPAGKKNMLQQFNEKQTKGNIQNTLLKTVADAAGIGIGTVLSAVSGKAAPIVGALLIGSGHYIGDESGLLRVVGASTIAHGVAKAREYRENPDQTIKDRLVGVKDDWLTAALLKHYDKNLEGFTVEPIPQPDGTSMSTLHGTTADSLPNFDREGEANNKQFESELDLSGLDEFERMNEEAAVNYQQARQAENSLFPDDEDLLASYLYDPSDEPRNWPPYDQKGGVNYEDSFDENDIDFNDF